jgi:hypothetical protein
MSEKLQINVSDGHKPWTLMHMDNAKIHTAKVVSSVMPDLRFERHPNRHTVQTSVYFASPFVLVKREAATATIYGSRPTF